MIERERERERKDSKREGEKEREERVGKNLISQRQVIWGNKGRKGGWRRRGESYERLGGRGEGREV